MIRALFLSALALAACQSAPPPPPMETPADWWGAYYDPSRVRLADGRNMKLVCSGTGSPTVIFESGLGSSAVSWRVAQLSIAKTTRACSYDRAGLGGSDPGPNPRDVTAITNDLEALIKAAKLKGPFVLVGHSMGSYPMQMFAYRHPEQVAGMVLVDPSADNQEQRFREAAPGIAAMQAAEMDTPKKCLAALERGPIARDNELYAACIAEPQPDMPADLLPRFTERVQSPEPVRARIAEYAAFDGSSAQLIAARRPLTGIPLIVLTATNTTKIPGLSEAEQTALGRTWFDLHTALANLSDKSQHRTANTGHAIHREQPEVAIAAIEEVIAAARGR